MMCRPCIHDGYFDNQKIGLWLRDSDKELHREITEALAAGRHIFLRRVTGIGEPNSLEASGPKGLEDSTSSPSAV